MSVASKCKGVGAATFVFVLFDQIFPELNQNFYRKPIIRINIYPNFLLTFCLLAKL